MAVIRDKAANSIALLIRQTTNQATKTLQQQLKENIGRLAVRDAAGLIANEILAQLKNG